jgi:hypothetical protein
VSARSPSASAPSSSVASLARVEGRKLVCHPLFVAGVGITLIGATIFVRTSTSRAKITWDDDAWTVSAGFVILAMFTMITANFAALRDRREHTTEQHAALPVDASKRTGGLLAATLWPAAVAIALLGAVAGYGATKVSLTSADRVHLVAQIVIIVMLGMFGITLATVAPHPFVAPLAAWALLFLTPSDHPRPWQVLAPLTGLRDAGLSGWHIAYQIGLTALLATLALAKTARRRTTLLGVTASLVLVVAPAIVLVSRACPSPGRCLF